MKIFFLLGVSFTSFAFIFFLLSDIPNINKNFSNDNQIINYVKSLKEIKNLEKSVNLASDNYQSAILVDISNSIIESIKLKYPTEIPIGSYKFVDLMYKENQDEEDFKYITTFAIPTNGNRLQIKFFNLNEGKFVNYVWWRNFSNDDIRDVIYKPIAKKDNFDY